MPRALYSRQSIFVYRGRRIQNLFKMQKCVFQELHLQFNFLNCQNDILECAK